MSSHLEDPDAQMFLRFREGDERAFETLVEKYKGPIFNYIWRQIRDYDEAEDIAQNVFVQVYKSAHRYEPTAKFTTWLFTIARNLCLNEFRRRHRHPLESLDRESNSEMEAQPREDPRAKAAHVVLNEKELEERVLGAIQKLPENQRTALMLCRYEEMSYQEIAQVLNATESATKSLIHRARETLRSQLKDIMGD